MLLLLKKKFISSILKCKLTSSSPRIILKYTNFGLKVFVKYDFIILVFGRLLRNTTPLSVVDPIATVLEQIFVI